MTDVYSGELLLPDHNQDHESRIDALESPTVDAWTDLSSGLLASWTGTFKIRRLTVPGYPDMLLIYCSISPGTKTDGTKIVSFPIGRRPVTDKDVAFSVSSLAGATAQNPHFSIQTNGDVSIWGCANTTGINVSTIMILEL